MNRGLLSKINGICNLEYAVHYPGGGIRYFSPGFDRALTFAAEEGLIEDKQRGLTYYKSQTEKGEIFVAVYGTGEASLNYVRIITAFVTDEGSIPEPDANEKVRLLLMGELNSVQTNMLRAQYADEKFNHYMLAIRATKEDTIKNIRHIIDAMSDKRDMLLMMDSTTLLFLRHAEDDGEEYRSASDFANVIYNNIKVEVRASFTVIAEGTVRSFDEFASGYEKILFTYKYGKIIAPNAGVYAYKDYVLLRLLSVLSSGELNRCLDSLLERNTASIIEDEELMMTAEEFMKNSLNISKTSETMFVHRNTLIYRLDKIEKETGLNLRVFSDAVVFRLINILSALTKD